jgi:SagB-type dehydrogenase family enzyme
LLVRRHRYLPDGHQLQKLKDENLRSNLARAALWQSAVRNAAIDIVTTVVYSRITTKYGERGIRYAYIEAGHIAQNVYLQAVALGLASVRLLAPLVIDRCRKP